MAILPKKGSYQITAEICPYECFPPDGRGEYPQGLEIFENLGSDSLPMSHKCVSKIPCLHMISSRIPILGNSRGETLVGALIGLQKVRVDVMICRLRHMKIRVRRKKKVVLPPKNWVGRSGFFLTQMSMFGCHYASKARFYSHN